MTTTGAGHNSPSGKAPWGLAERYQHTKRGLGRQRGPKVAQIDLSRKLAEAIWHMLTRKQPFAPAGAPFV
jgi:hypothetical protein